MQKQVFCTEIAIRAPSVLESEQWSDCKFVVGDEPDQVIVGGYKLVMALASPVFEAMFYGSLAETKNPIPIVDVDPDTFKVMLQYLYTDKMKVSSVREACQLYYAAKKYMLDQLMGQCSKYLQDKLTSENVCEIYQHSLLFEDVALSDNCKKMFSEYTKNILIDKSFVAADLDTVVTIFSLDSLNLDSELDLIEAAARYAKAQDIKCKEETSINPLPSMEEINKQLTPGPSNLNFDTSEKQLIRDAVRKIRLLTLTPQQYASCAARYSLLTLSEDHAILMNIVCDNSDVPMPNGFSTSKVDRISSTTFYTKIEGCGTAFPTSQARYFRNLKWQIKMHMELDYKSLYFYLVCNSERPSIWSCDTSAQLRLVSHKPDVKPIICDIQKIFSHKIPECCTERFNTNEIINYIKDDSIETEVFIKVNKLLVNN